jgi:molybdopterin-guanine dinucleotide biosynthesis protein A
MIGATFGGKCGKFPRVFITLGRAHERIVAVVLFVLQKFVGDEVVISAVDQPLLNQEFVWCDVC